MLAIIMGIAGLWAIITGRIPSFLLGGRRYKFEGRGVRLLGVVLLLPYPITILGGFMLFQILGEDAEGYITILNFVTIVGVGLATIIISRKIRQPASVVETDSKLISTEQDGVDDPERL